MTKKDYVKIAAALRCTRNDYPLAEPDILDSVCQRLATVLKDDNPKFDRAKFYKACGLLQDAACGVA